MALPTRKPLRLKGYDYSLPGMYAVTLCIEGRACLLGATEGDGIRLNPAGEMVQQTWLRLAEHFPDVMVDAFVVMPNHLHGILGLSGPPETQRTPLPDILSWFKTVTTSAYIRGVRKEGWASFDGQFWQRGYYDHIIRGERDGEAIRAYITRNPAQWASDKENPAVAIGGT